MLFAGTTSILSFRYFILNDTVKKLKQWSKSAGNIFVASRLENETSETLRNETVVNTENIKPISVHVPKHLKPIKDAFFGHYLAGLIDGNSDFKEQQLVIEFHSLDAFLAYYIKKRLGFGSVKKVKDKNTFVLVIAARKGMKKVINLINGKIRTKNKFFEIINNILNHDNYAKFRKKNNFNLNLNKDLKNHWLAGFSDADANFQIKIVNYINKIEIILNFQFDEQKKENISVLFLIKNFLGGRIFYNKIKKVYEYNSYFFGSAKKIVHYFDGFHLLSSKHINYLKWRKSYIIIQRASYKNYLNKNAFVLCLEDKEKIIKFKNTMNR